MFKLGKFIIMTNAESLEREQKALKYGLRAGRALALYETRQAYCRLDCSDTVAYSINPMTISQN